MTAHEVPAARSSMTQTRTRCSARRSRFAGRQREGALPHVLLEHGRLEQYFTQRLERKFEPVADAR